MKYPKLNNPYDAIVQALVLAITAPTEALATRCIDIANDLLDKSPDLSNEDMGKAMDKAALIVQFEDERN